jgi:hypothetical protein
MPPHSDLPIISLDPEPRRPARERYGALFYLGVGGLVLLVGLIGRFAHQAWSLRSIWANVYVLHDQNRTDDERINAALALSRDPRVGQELRHEICLRKPLPRLARYLLAESLTTGVLAADPTGYAVAVARSEGWPDWLRLLLARPLVYAAGAGYSGLYGSLNELTARPDPILRLWAAYARACGPTPEAGAAQALRAEARVDGPRRELARLLETALRAPTDPERLDLLNRATLWLRDHHPEAREIWSGWVERDGRLVRRPASELPLLDSGPSRVRPDPDPRS